MLARQNDVIHVVLETGGASLGGPESAPQITRRIESKAWHDVLGLPLYFPSHLAYELGDPWRIIDLRDDHVFRRLGFGPNLAH